MEPRFTGPGASRGGGGGGYDGGAPRGGFGGGYGGPPAGGNGRQIYVSNVCTNFRSLLANRARNTFIDSAFLASLQCRLAGS